MLIIKVLYIFWLSHNFIFCCGSCRKRGLFSRKYYKCFHLFLCYSFTLQPLQTSLRERFNRTDVIEWSKSRCNHDYTFHNASKQFMMFFDAFWSYRCHIMAQLILILSLGYIKSFRMKGWKRWNLEFPDSLFLGH